MNEYEIIPFSGDTGACWLLAEVTTPTFDDPPKERTFADLGWSADGTRERYRHVGTFTFLDEAKVAIEAMNAAIVEPGGTAPRDIANLLLAQEFSCPPPRGFSHSSSGIWQRTIDERWFVWFGDDMIETILRVTDCSKAPPSQESIGRLVVSHDLEEAAGGVRTLPYRALLAILEMRMKSGSPGRADEAGTEA